MKFILLFPALLAFRAAVCQSSDTGLTGEFELVKAEPLPPHCGIVAFSLAQQFRVVVPGRTGLQQGAICYLIQSCPEFLGPDFFKNGTLYRVTVKPGPEIPYSTVTLYPAKKDQLPEYRIIDIRKLTN